MRLLLLALAAAPGALEAPWPAHTIARGFPNQTAVAADFTGDGLPDVITNDYRRTLLYVAPRWEMKVLHEGVHVIHSLAFDVDGDGDTDFAGARYSPGLVFWLERPARPLEEPWVYHLIDRVEDGGADGIHGIAAADIDADGRLDLAGTSGQPKGVLANSLVWWRCAEGKDCRKPWQRWVAGRWNAPGLAHYVGLGDVNGDGRIDIATGAKFPPDGNWFAWWEQPDAWDQPFVKHLISDFQEGATNILMADVNRDGKMDFVASRGHGLGVVWFEGPTWKEHVIDPDIGGPHSLAVGDIDGDGDIDAATVGKNSMLACWYENDGKGRFTRHVMARNQAAYDVKLIDMDNDGDLDLLVAGQESKNVVWLENRLRTRK